MTCGSAPWAFMSPYYYYWSRAGNAVIGWTGIADAMELGLAGLLLAYIAASAGQRGLSRRIAGLFFGTAAVVLPLGYLGRNPFYYRPWYIVPTLLIGFAALSTATWFLLVRFAGMSLWNRSRWWAWAGHPADPDADRPAA
jgi:hypothetical protein